MKGYSLAIILILWSIGRIDFIYGQKTVKNSEAYDSYSEDISFDGIQDLNFENAIKTEEPPEKIGELEFEVEVAEQTPDSREMAPEVLVVDDKPRNRKKGKDSEVITDVAVDMMGSSQIGDIELNIEVEDQKTTKDVENFENLTEENEKITKELSNNSRAKPSQQTKGIRNFQNLLEDSQQSTSTSTSTSTSISTKRTTTKQKQTESTKEVTNSSQTNDGKETSDLSDTKPTDIPKEPQKKPIWPLILLAIVFNILVIIGIIWAISRLCIIKKKSDEQERKIAVLKAADIEKKGGTQQQPPPQQ